MTDLACKQCGWTLSYADASISDTYRECPESFDGKHDWDENQPVINA